MINDPKEKFLKSIFPNFIKLLDIDGKKINQE